jgi:hypothetical protein
MILSNYLSILFNPDEATCYGNLYANEVKTAYEAGQGNNNFISLNPMEGRRSDVNVTSHRNFLVELDDGSTTSQQLRLADDLGLPYSTAVWSGGKSVHFVIAMEQEVEAYEWRSLAAALIASVPGADPSTKNPSRFTRLPDQFREDKQAMQTLLRARGRVSVETVREYCKPHIVQDLPPLRENYNKIMGLNGILALHPMSISFLRGTHPCDRGRNNALFITSCDLRDHSYELEEAEEMLLKAAYQYGLDDREARTAIRSAFNRRRHA